MNETSGGGVWARRIENHSMADCGNALTRWTGKANATIIYDSTVDEFTYNGGIFKKIKGKENTAVIGFTTDGDVFGGFNTVALTKHGKESSDPNTFFFSFESHGRCETPQRFVVKNDKKTRQRFISARTTTGLSSSR